MVLAKFRQRYPQGSLVSELIDIDRGTYIVGVSIIVNNIILSTGLAGADSVETAEDLARERAIATLMLDSQNQGERDNLNPEPTQNDIATVRPKTTSPAKEKLTLDNHNRTSIEDSNVARSAENLTSPTTQSNHNALNLLEDSTSSISSSFGSEVLEQENSNESVVESQVAVPPTEESVSNSANLFAGTSNPDITYDSSLPDNHTSSEALAADAEIDRADTLAEVNFNEIKHQTDLEIKRLGWTKDDGREFLKSRYGKRSRLQLTDNQLLEFLQYLASQPSPS